MGIGGSRLFDLQTLGQSVWLECDDPRMLARSKLTFLIRAGISGIDANPASLANPERLRIEDAQHTADGLLRVYDATGWRDGYSNIEVSPAVADDAAGIESEARRLWADINRPNVMIKVPATGAGLLAMRRCIAAGLNINATEIFGARCYAAVHEAYLLGLQDRRAAGLPLESVASVASVMVGRIDAAVDKQLEAIEKPAKAPIAKRLRGKAALAIAQYVYQHFKSVLSSPQWLLLATCHAQRQRLLWAGTETSAAHDGGLKYVHELIGRDTVTAMSLSTVDAYLDHGAAAPTLERNLLQVLALLGELEAVGVDLDRVNTQLQRKRASAMCVSPAGAYSS